MIESKFLTVKNPFGVGLARYCEKHHGITSGYALAQFLEVSTRTACSFFEDDYKGPGYTMLTYMADKFGHKPSEFLEIIEEIHKKEKKKKKKK